LQPLEYNLDVSVWGQLVTLIITFTKFLDSDGLGYGALIYLLTHEMENQLNLFC
jgi:hypothetical protein